MQGENLVYHLKVDMSGRIALPTELRSRQHIAGGDTVILVADEAGVHIKTREQALAEARAYFAQLAPANVLLSQELLADRLHESERD